MLVEKADIEKGFVKKGLYFILHYGFPLKRCSRQDSRALFFCCGFARVFFC